MNATSNSVTNGIPVGVSNNSTSNNAANDLQNSFLFGASNFGSVSTMKEDIMQPTLGPQVPKSGGGGHKVSKSGGQGGPSQSPFTIQGKVKKIVNREDEILSIESQKKQRRDKRDRNQSAVEQAIAALPMVRRDYAAAQTFEQNTARAYDNIDSTARKSLENLRNGRVRQSGEQYKTQGKAAVSRSDPRGTGAGQSQDEVPPINKSYQGNLTKLLRQAHMNELEQNRNSTMSGRHQGAYLKPNQVRGAGFYNSAAAHSAVEKPSSTDMSSWDLQTKQ